MYKLQLILDWRAWCAVQAWSYYHLTRIPTLHISTHKQYRKAIQFRCMSNRLAANPRKYQQPPYRTMVFLSAKTNCAQCLIDFHTLLTKISPTVCRFNRRYTGSLHSRHYLNIALLRDAIHPQMPLKIFADYLEEKHPRPAPIFLDMARYFPQLPKIDSFVTDDINSVEHNHAQHDTALNAIKHISHQECIEWLNSTTLFQSENYPTVQ